MTAFPPTQRYEFVRTLGVGGMGAVFEARDVHSGAHVALKTILEPDADALLRFKREFRIAADMHHPHLVRLYDLVAEGKHWFFTMELVRGGNVVDALRPHGVQRFDEHATTPARRSAPAEALTVDVAAVRRAAAQIADALDFLHQRGVVHRDIKPHNIAIDDVGNVRVMDFGLANRRGSDPRISESNIVVGTLAYLAPELLVGRPASPASDMYALGVILFQVLTGRMPAQPGSVGASSVRQLVDVDDELGRLVDALLAREPQQRPSAAAVRAALGEAPRGAAARSGLFVGRAAERAALHDAVEAVAGGAAHTAFIVGPSGIGKSALAEQVVTDAVGRGFAAFMGRCYERERVPLLAFDRIVDAIVLALREWSLAEMAEVTPHLRRLAGAFPVVELLVAGGNSGTNRHPREQRQTILDAVVELVAVMCRRQPVLLVCDDLHWADEESLVLLEALMQRQIPRLLLLGLLRSAGTSTRLTALLQEPSARCLTLQGLQLDELAALGAAAGVHDTNWALAALSEGNGNPLLARHWAMCAAQPQSQPDAGPLSISAVMRAAFADLSPDATTVLQILAVAGGDLSVHLLADVSGLDANAQEAALSELVAQRLLLRVPGDQPRIDFSHDRWRETAYDGLDDDRKRQLHAQLAAAIEKLTTPTLRDVEALLRHWGVAGDVEKRRAFTRQAAERALKQSMWRRAGELLRSLLLDDTAGTDNTSAAWQRVGDLFEWSGSHAEALEAYTRAFDLLNHDDTTISSRAQRLALLSRLAEHSFALGQTSTMLARCREGLAMLGLPLERPLSSRLMHLAMLNTRASLTRRRAPQVREPTSPQEQWQLEEMRFLRACVRVLFLASMLASAECDVRAGLLGPHTGDADGVLRSIAGTAVVTMFRARPAAADVARLRRQLDDAEAFARAHKLTEGLAYIHHNRAVVWLVSDLERAKTASEASLALYRQLGLIDSLDGVATQMMHQVILLLRGDDEELRRGCEEALRAGNYARSCSALTVLSTHEYARADAVGLSLLLERYRALAGHETSEIADDVTLAELQLLVCRGEAEAALAFVDGPRGLTGFGAQLQVMRYTMWNVAAVEAALLLADAGRLTPHQRSAAARRARWLVNRGALHFDAFGWRAEAVLAGLDGNSAQARRCIEQALAQTTTASPWIRTFCVDTALALGLHSEELAREAAALHARYRYARPTLQSPPALAHSAPV